MNISLFNLFFFLKISLNLNIVVAWNSFEMALGVVCGDLWHNYCFERPSLRDQYPGIMFEHER